LVPLLFAGCRDTATGDISDTADYYYFSGLDALRSGSPINAERFFRLGAQHGSPVFSRRCGEELVKLGAPEERVREALRFAGTWQDNDARLTAARACFAAGKLGRILTITQDIHRDTPGQAPPELVYLRLTALLRKDNRDFSSECSPWLTETPFTRYHQALCTELFAPGMAEKLSEGTIALARFRSALFRRSYGEAAALLTGILANHDDPAAFAAALPAVLVSDLGRTLLYGQSDSEKPIDFVKNALFCERTARLAQNDETAYAALFYAGRLYDRSGEKNALIAAERFLEAVQRAPTPGQKDDALWYYLTILLKSSPDEVLQALPRLPAEISNRRAFQGFFENLAARLFQDARWEAFYRIAPTVIALSGTGTGSKYAYLAGRLVETGLVKPAEIDDPAGAAQTWFRRACESGDDLYYKLLAASCLDSGGNTQVKTIAFTAASTANTPAADSADQGLGRLLRGYAEFEFPERVYSEWLKERERIGADVGMALAEYLEQSGDEVFQVQGIRIALYSAAGTPLSPDSREWRLLYPRFFLEEIEDAAAESGLPDYLLYALVRTESLFERTASSHAAARGLTQLMPETAADIARRLGVGVYDVDDARTNLRFGAWYLADLTKRLDGAILPAAFAYNAGLNRVRTWIRASKLPDTAPDLFLESLPYAETRDYGRRLLAAAAAYGQLYRDILPEGMVSYILGKGDSP
jgi:soluble lytic murein transglycosylase